MTNYGASIRFTKMTIPAMKAFDRMPSHLATKVSLALAIRCAQSQSNQLIIGELERNELAVHYEVSERRIANVMSELSRPSEKGGVEVLVKKQTGVYLLNPTIFHVGKSLAHERAIEEYYRLRQERMKERKSVAEKRKELKKLSKDLNFDNVVELKQGGTK